MWIWVQEDDEHYIGRRREKWIFDEPRAVGLVEDDSQYLGNVQLRSQGGEARQDGWSVVIITGFDYTYVARGKDANEAVVFIVN